MNSNFSNITERFIWTAIQAFVGSLPATFALSGHDLRAVLYSGLTAGIAAIISLAKNLTVATQAGPPLPPAASTR